MAIGKSAIGVPLPSARLPRSEPLWAKLRAGITRQSIIRHIVFLPSKSIMGSPPRPD